LAGGIRDKLISIAQNYDVGSDRAINVDQVLRCGMPVGSVIECHQHLPRAMDRGRLLIKAEAEEGRSMKSGTVILADTMTHCKGRFTRSWHAPKGGVWGCLVHGNDFLPQSRHFIPMAVGIACYEAVLEFGADGAAVRWVNDVLVNGMKLAGFLVESYTEPIYSEEFTLVGFGINVNNCSFPDELDGMAVSLAQSLGKEVDLQSFTTVFLAHLAWNFGILYHEEAKEMAEEPFSGRGGEHLLLERWKQVSDTVGKRVVYGFDVVTNPQYKGLVTGVDGSGGLVLCLEDGTCKTEYSGEVRYL
jgi:BirA family biotin operon repressor/biotin-[acetyl-CoA-carboxylase] ligase